MSTWLYIASGIGAFIVFVLMFVLMTLADDFEQVNGTENNAPVTYDEARETYKSSKIEVSR